MYGESLSFCMREVDVFLHNLADMHQKPLVGFGLCVDAVPMAYHQHHRQHPCHRDPSSPCHENQDKDLKAVQGLEVWMDVMECWAHGSPECHEAAKLLHMC
jgi:hypothetical protein